MNDRRIDQLTDKPNLLDTDLVVVAESSGTTWKSTIEKFRDSLFGLVGLVSGSPEKNDSVFFRRFVDGKIRRVPFQKLLPSGVVTNDMLADGSDAQGTGIAAVKLAPSSVTNPKLAVDAVHTHNIMDAEPANIDNYPPKVFGTGITTEKICDGAVTGVKGGVPPGAVFHFAALQAPAGYLVCNGDLITDDYEQTTQGVNNWRLQDLRLVLATTFGQYGQLPDLRGSFLRGYSGPQGNVGVGRFSVYKHFLVAGTGPKTAAEIAAQATNLATDPSLFSYFVIEWTSNATTLANPNQGPWNPRAGIPVNVVPWGKGTTPSVNLTANARYKLYAMRYTPSGQFGQHQEHRYMAHTHAISETSHIHTVGTTLNSNAWAHIHDRIQVGYRSGGVGKSNWLTGGDTGLKPGQGNNYAYDDVSQPRWSGVPPIIDAATTTMQVQTTYATCEHSMSYGYGAVLEGQPIVYSQPINTSAISFDPVDETRPENVSLLPCIKY